MKLVGQCDRYASIDANKARRKVAEGRSDRPFLSCRVELMPENDRNSTTRRRDVNKSTKPTSSSGGWLQFVSLQSSPPRSGSVMAVDLCPTCHYWRPRG